MANRLANLELAVEPGWCMGVYCLVTTTAICCPTPLFKMLWCILRAVYTTYCCW